MKPIVKELVLRALDESKDIDDYPNKFAEICVEECYALIMDQVRLAISNNIRYEKIDGMEMAAELLKERFGVK